MVQVCCLNCFPILSVTQCERLKLAQQENVLEKCGQMLKLSRTELLQLAKLLHKVHAKLKLLNSVCELVFKLQCKNLSHHKT